MSDVSTFGAWLRHHRRTLDLTQAALAELVGCSLSSIRKFESDEQRPSRYMAEVLAARLTIPPAERAAFVQFARLSLDAAPPALPLLTDAQLPPPPQPRHAASPPPFPAPLPCPPTALIGRGREIADVAAMLRRPEVRLLTLTGAGGAGKTRLAIAAARELASGFADGVCFVDLASLTNADLVLSGIAQALGVREMPGTALAETLQVFLRDQHLLLLIDNFEQVLAAAPLLASLLAACPQLCFLVTSRASLRLSGEHEYPIPPLALPPLRIRPPQPSDQIATSWWRGEIEQYAAVQLFVARAQAVLPGFTLTEAYREIVAAICRRLDGLPLAIELAAARSKLLPPAVLHDRLHDRLGVLTGGPRDLPARQQTLRATIAWSYDLLTVGEQRLFRRLAVFVGGWTLEAAEAVCGEAGLDGLQALLDQSLIQQEAVGERGARFRMLETIHEYAREQLQASGERETLRRQHAVYYGDTIRPLVLNDEQTINDAEAHLRIDTEFDNLYAALQWAIEQRETEIGLWLSGFALTYHTVASLQERLAWIESLLALDDTATTHATLLARATARRNAGWSAALLGMDARAHSHFLAALELCREMEDGPRIAKAYRELGWTLAARGSAAEAEALHWQSLALTQSIHDEEGIAWSQADLGYQLFLRGNLTGAQQLLSESLARFQSHEHAHGIASACYYLGQLARAQGHDRLAAHWYHTCVRQQRPPSFVISIYVTAAIENLAGLCVAQGRPEEAARLLGAAACVRGHVGVPPVPLYRVCYERDLAAIHARLEPAAFGAAWEAGRGLTLEQAINSALDAPVDPLVP